MTASAVSKPSLARPARSLTLAWWLAASMCLASVVAHLLRPTKLLADTRGAASLSALVPSTFGEWHEVRTAQSVVNPQSQQMIDTLYTEVLNRTYRNAAGQQVMLAIAYGRDQTDELQLHEPRVCYPAQGFAVLRQWNSDVRTSYGSIPVHRLETILGSKRPEPVTYWTTIGDQVVEAKVLDKKRKKFFYSLDGYIPDGLLFRVSSIDTDTSHAFALQDRFARDLLASVPPQTRRRLAGLVRSNDASNTH